MPITETPPDDRDDAEAVVRDRTPTPLTGNAPKLTPESWAELIFPKTATGRFHDDAWKHSAADALHGWTAYKARTGQDVELDEAAYRTALTAASSNTFTAHPAADFRPKKG